MKKQSHSVKKHHKSHTSHKGHGQHKGHVHKIDPQKDMTRKIIILIIVVLLAIAVTEFFFSMYKVVTVQTMPMNITVMNKLGFNLDPGTVHFGGVPPGNCGTRGLWIENKLNKTLIVDIRRYGDIAPWVETNNQTFFIQPLEKTNVKFSACVPYNTTEGNYSGTIAVVMKRP